MNPLFNLLGGGQNQMMAQIRNIAGMMRGNPQAMLQNNPQAQQLIAQHGGDPKKAFYALAQQMGIDPNEVVKTLGM